MSLWIVFIKNLVKSSLDQYVFPGTLTGTEILWLYIIQWKRDLATLTVASLYTVLNHMDIPRMASIKSNPTDEPN
jgi:hypothetical protein